MRQLHPLMSATGFRAALAAGVLDQNPPHGFGGGGKEVATAIPMLGLRVSTSRMYASCTSAVACSVCPGFSWAIFAAASFRNSS